MSREVLPSRFPSGRPGPPPENAGITPGPPPPKPADERIAILEARMDKAAALVAKLLERAAANDAEIRRLRGLLARR